MSKTYTLTAAEAAKDETLWEKVRRGEVALYNKFGRDACMLKLRDDGRVEVTCGMYAWQADASDWGDWPGDMKYTVVVLSESEQEENSPANVERLKARIADVEGLLGEVCDKGCYEPNPNGADECGYCFAPYRRRDGKHDGEWVVDHRADCAYARSLSALGREGE